jgi:hypothetical protein
MIHNLLETVLNYHKLGLNISHILPTNIELKKGLFEQTNKKPSHSLFNLSKERQTINQIKSYDWDNACGVGIVMGFENLRVLDIDSCHSIVLIETICEILGLPINYEWVVRTGSHNGYHIYFYCDNFEYKVPKGKVKAFVPKRRYEDSFGHLELRWRGHVVAPKSKHISGKDYEFVNTYFPRNKPTHISIEKMQKVISRFCFDVEEYYRRSDNHSYYQNFVDDEYAFRCVYPSGGGISIFGIYKMPFYLFLDLETNGLPQNWTDPERDCDMWPEIVQIAYLICDADGKRIKEASSYIRPDNWELSEEASSFLNISNEELKRKGNLLDSVFNEYNSGSLFNNEEFFGTLWGEQFPFKYIIGHNIEYDINCLKALYFRNKSNNYRTVGLINDLITQIPTLCTMKLTTNFCALGGGEHNKYPKLEELYEKLFDEKVHGLHNAQNDVKVTAACFWRLKDLKIMNA